MRFLNKIICQLGMAFVAVTAPALQQAAWGQPAPALRAVVSADAAPEAMSQMFGKLGDGESKISVPGAAWLQLQFSEVSLGPGGVLTITDASGESQKFSQDQIDAWGGLSAVFNGSELRISLTPGQGAMPVSARIKDIIIGLPASSFSGAEVVAPQPLRDLLGDDIKRFIPNDLRGSSNEGVVPEAICGATDDRVASSNPRVGRIVPIGCTGWLIGGGNLLTAGHCIGAATQTVEFNVPASQPDGTIVAPPVRDQYRIIAASFVSQAGGVGNDWALFRVLPNTQTGLTPAAAQSATFQLSNTANPAQVRITGYGVDGPAPNFGAGGPRNSQSQTQQTHVGRLSENTSGATSGVLHYDVDTQGGNSGSPVIVEGDNIAIGIHTNGGCTPSGGTNAGTSFRNAALWAATEPPTIDPIPNQAPLTYRDGLQTIQLQSISDGTPDKTQGISITATSSHPAVIPTPSINYRSDDSSGTLSYRAVPGSMGSSNITVTVTADGGTPNDPGDDSSTSTSFTVQVLAAKPCDGRGCFTYVGQRDHGVVNVIDAATNEIVKTIPLSLLGGVELAITPDGNRAYAIGFTGGPAHVSIIDLQTNAEIGMIDLTGAPSSNATSLALSPDGGFLYVTVANNTLGFDDVVLVINTATNALAKSITLGNEIFPDGIAFSPNGTRGYITTDSGSLLVLDTMNQAIIANLTIDTGPHHLAVIPDGGRVYVVNRDSDSVSVVNAATNQVIGNVALGDRPEGIAITPDGRFAYVSVRASASNGRLEVIDTTTNAVTKTIFLNGLNGPKEIGITPDGTRAYVTFETDLVVSMIAIATHQVAGTITIGTPTIGITISGIPPFTRRLGDINRDGSINKTDVEMLTLDLNKPINGTRCGLPCDLDGDGKITVLDSRRLVNLCSKPQCAMN